MTDPTPPKLIPAFRLTIEYHAPLVYGSMTGDRAFLRAASARAEGAELAAELADEGGDWLVFRADGLAEIDGRMMLRCPDGEMVYWRSRGVLTCAETGFDGRLSLQPWFDAETGPRALMTKTVYLATGFCADNRATLDVWRLP